MANRNKKNFIPHLKPGEGTPWMDDYCLLWSRGKDNEKAMLKHAAATESATEYKRVPIKSIYLAPVVECEHFAVSDKVVEDTALNGTGLAVQLGGKWYPLAESAKKSLLDRCRISGNVIGKLPFNKYADLCNICLSVQGGSALAVIRESKIRAIHSGDAAGYSKLPIPGLLREVLDALEKRFPGSQFLGGYTSHELTEGTWSCPDQAQELLCHYEDALKASTSFFKERGKVVPAIRFVTSDTGKASASVDGALVGDSFILHIGEIISIDHKGKASVESFRDELGGLFAQFRDTISSLEGLLDIEIRYPLQVFAACCKKYALPVGPSNKVYEQLEKVLGESSCTAYDVYMGLQEALSACEEEKWSEVNLWKFRESVSKALSMTSASWHTLDVPRRKGVQ